MSKVVSAGPINLGSPYPGPSAEPSLGSHNHAWNPQEWEPGEWGKGFTYQGRPHTWVVSNPMVQGGSPHHDDVFDSLYPEHPMGGDAYADPIVIHPEGWYTADDGRAVKDPTAFARHQPGMKDHFGLPYSTDSGWSDRVVISPEGYYTHVNYWNKPPTDAIDPSLFARVNRKMKYMPDANKWQIRTQSSEDPYEIRPADEGWFSHDTPYPDGGAWNPRYNSKGDDTLLTRQGQGEGSVAYHQGQPVASLTWQEFPDRILLGSAWTHPEHRQRGLFNRLSEPLRASGKPIDAFHWDNPWLKHKVRDWRLGKVARPVTDEFFNAWNQRNPEPVLYHGTHPRALPSIMERGLLPWDHPDNPSGTQWLHDKWVIGRPGHVYFAQDPYRARDIASQNMMGYGLPAVLKIDRRHLDPRNINPDEDEMRGHWGPDYPSPSSRIPSDHQYTNLGEAAEHFGWGEDPADTQSMIDQGTPVAYRGVIPPHAITPGYMEGNQWKPLMRRNGEWPREIGHISKVKRADYNGWSNWETWNTKLMMDNERHHYERMHQIAEQGGGPEDLRQHFEPNLIGPYNRERLQEAQEWNAIHPDERRRMIDERDRAEYGDAAVDTGHSLMEPFGGFNDPGEDDTAQLIDPHLVNWDEIHHNILSEYPDDHPLFEQYQNPGPTTFPQEWTSATNWEFESLPAPAMMRTTPVPEIKPPRNDIEAIYRQIGEAAQRGDIEEVHRLYALLPANMRPRTADAQHNLWFKPKPHLQPGTPHYDEAWGRGLVTPGGEIYTWPEIEMEHRQRAQALGVPDDPSRQFGVNPQGNFNSRVPLQSGLPYYIEEHTGFAPQGLPSRWLFERSGQVCRMRHVNRR